MGKKKGELANWIIDEFDYSSVFTYLILISWLVTYILKAKQPTNKKKGFKSQTGTVQPVIERFCLKHQNADDLNKKPSSMATVCR